MTDKIPESLPDIKYDNTKVYIQFSDVHGRGVFAKNPRFEINYKELYGKVIANKVIKIDEEILVDYGPHYSFPKGKMTNHEDSPR